jgi:hypothetical protein
VILQVLFLCFYFALQSNSHPSLVKRV